jgi:hypothetical protein
MDADRLYVSERAAAAAGNKAITDNKADGFRVRPQRCAREGTKKMLILPLTVTVFVSLPT